MSDPVQLLAPREGVNDDVVRIVEWRVADGDQVAADQIVVIIETTKATVDVAASGSGYLHHLAPQGGEVAVGAPLAWITAQPRRPAVSSAGQPSAAASTQVVTAKAQPLLEQHGLTAADFPGLAVIRTSDVEQLLAQRASTPQPQLARRFRGELLDPAANWDEVLQRADSRQLAELLDALRRRMKAQHNRHVPTGTLLHDRWQLAKDHGFGEGTSVYDECLILGEVQVGKHCWVGPYTVLDGQGGLSIGDYVDIGAGAHLYSHNTIQRALTGHQAPLFRKATRIGNCCFIAPHAVIGAGTVLGDRCFVAAGSYVEGAFPEGTFIAGNPAKAAGKIVVQGNKAHINRQ